MKLSWKKKGRIFDPTEHVLPDGCDLYAQSPQALVIDNFVRVYFSTRRQDNGKFISCVAYADFDKAFSRLINVSKRPVIDSGGLGCFDEHGIFPISPVQVGNRVYAYTCGWSRRVAVSVETSIGLAVSTDGGDTFERYGVGPVLTSSLYEPMLVGDGFVRRINDVFHMWYIFGTRWISSSGGQPERVYKIAHATSTDGITWVTERGRQIVRDRLGENECQALPTVIEMDGRWHMFFCYRQATDFRKNRERAYRIGYAWSVDLIDWIREDENVGIDVSVDGWDSEMLCYPNVFECDSKVFLLYNGNEFGKFGFGLAELESIRG